MYIIRTSYAIAIRASIARTCISLQFARAPCHAYRPYRAWTCGIHVTFIKLETSDEIEVIFVSLALYKPVWGCVSLLPESGGRRLWSYTAIEVGRQYIHNQAYKWMGLDELLVRVAGLLVDKCLQYPVICSLMFTLGLYVFAPLFWDTDATKGWRWVLSCTAVCVLSALVTVGLIPTLHITAPRILFRPTPSCSTFDSPARYICFTLDHHQQVFYITTLRKCDSSDPKMREATKFYIVSSWIPSFDHFLTRREIQFQPVAVVGENKQSYPLPENYCVRGAGHTDSNDVKVAFYSLSGSQRILLDTGYINKSDLVDFHFGWYLVSSCWTDLERWLYYCEMGYVSSHYVSLPEPTRILLLEQRGGGPKE